MDDVLNDSTAARHQAIEQMLVDADLGFSTGEMSAEDLVATALATLYDCGYRKTSEARAPVPVQQRERKGRLHRIADEVDRTFPKPADQYPERGTQHRFSASDQICRHDFAGVWWNDNGVNKTGRECRHCGFFREYTDDELAEPEDEAIGADRAGVADAATCADLAQPFFPAQEMPIELDLEATGLGFPLSKEETVALWNDRTGWRRLFNETGNALMNAKADLARAKSTIENLAAEHDAIQGRVAELERVLAPFAEVADAYDPAEDDAFQPWQDAVGADFLRLTLGQHRAARAALEGGATVPRVWQGPEEMRFEYRHPNGERHTVTVSREQVLQEMPDFLFEALCAKFCHCEPVGETNVVDCNCDEYAEEFQLLAATAQAKTSAGGE